VESKSKPFVMNVKSKLLFLVICIDRRRDIIIGKHLRKAALVFAVSLSLWSCDGSNGDEILAAIGDVSSTDNGRDTESISSTRMEVDELPRISYIQNVETGEYLTQGIRLTDERTSLVLDQRLADYSPEVPQVFRINSLVDGFIIETFVSRDRVTRPPRLEAANFPDTPNAIARSEIYLRDSLLRVIDNGAFGNIVADAGEGTIYDQIWRIEAVEGEADTYYIESTQDGPVRVLEENEILLGLVNPVEFTGSDRQKWRIKEVTPPLAEQDITLREFDWQDDSIEVDVDWPDLEDGNVGYVRFNATVGTSDRTVADWFPDRDQKGEQNSSGSFRILTREEPVSGNTVCFSLLTVNSWGLESNLSGEICEEFVEPEENEDSTSSSDNSTFTLQLTQQPIVSGSIPYAARFPFVGGSDGRLLSIELNRAWPALAFPKMGYGTADCNDNSRVEILSPGSTLTSTQIENIYGSPTPAFPLTFVACSAPTTGRPPPWIPIVITF